MVIHYLAIGGPQVAAKVTMWASPTATGNRAVTGIGFQPETVLHFYGGAALLGPPPSSTFNGIFGLGVMNKNGGQWATQISDWDANNPTLTSRGQQTDAAIFMYADGSQAAVTKEASLVSMDADGFTMNFRAANANAGLICSLALCGRESERRNLQQVRPGPLRRANRLPPSGSAPAPCSSRATRRSPRRRAISESHASYGIGASDGTTEGSSAFFSADNVSPTSVDGLDKTSKVFLKMNTPPVDAEADLTSLDANGFTLNWTLNDGAATQIGYWALGAP